MMLRCLCFVSLAFFSSLVSAAFNCIFDIPPHHFNLEPLKGTHTHSEITPTPPTVENTTIFVNLCEELKWDGDVYDENKRCKDGTQICVIRYSQFEDKKDVLQIIPVASHSLDATTKLLPSQDSDAVRGVVVELHGQEYMDQPQKSVIKLTCNPTEEVGKLEYYSFDEGVLRLGWGTRYACPTSADDPPPEQDPQQPSSKHWGLLTWSIIIVFLMIAAYVIYSGFLNYSRYGAGTGWDLLPHADTFRDLPYLIRDFMNHVVSTFKGGSSRGGYSAV